MESAVEEGRVHWATYLGMVKLPNLLPSQLQSQLLHHQLTTASRFQRGSKEPKQTTTFEQMDRTVAISLRIDLQLKCMLLLAVIPFAFFLLCLLRRHRRAWRRRDLEAIDSEEDSEEEDQGEERSSGVVAVLHVAMEAEAATRIPWTKVEAVEMLKAAEVLVSEKRSKVMRSFDQDINTLREILDLLRDSMRQSFNW